MSFQLHTREDTPCEVLRVQGAQLLQVNKTKQQTKIRNKVDKQIIFQIGIVNKKREASQWEGKADFTL